MKFTTVQVTESDEKINEEDTLRGEPRVFVGENLGGGDISIETEGRQSGISVLADYAETEGREKSVICYTIRATGNHTLSLNYDLEGNFLGLEKGDKERLEKLKVFDLD